MKAATALLEIEQTTAARTLVRSTYRSDSSSDESVGYRFYVPRKAPYLARCTVRDHCPECAVIPVFVRLDTGNSNTDVFPHSTSLCFRLYLCASRYYCVLWRAAVWREYSTVPSVVPHCWFFYIQKAMGFPVVFIVVLSVVVREGFSYIPFRAVYQCLLSTTRLLPLSVLALNHTPAPALRSYTHGTTPPALMPNNTTGTRAGVQYLWC
jgi:hypothetical protein